LLKRARTDYMLRFGGELPNDLRAKLAPEWLQQLCWLNLRLDDPVLDVGCGNGARLFVMRDAGFTNLTGIDPFISEEADLPGVQLRRTSIWNMPGRYKLIMFNHSFEHMPHPETVLQRTRELLVPGGTVIIRTPLADCAALNRYGSFWAQLDAPRHIHIHTPASIELLASHAGLRLLRTARDSTAFQFWGSEQYMQGITLESESSWLRNPSASPFTREQINAWEHAARELNRSGRGDQGVLYLAAA
jgi:SAM-dependent methyltransferase